MTLDVSGAAVDRAPSRCTPYLRITTELLGVDRGADLESDFDEERLPVAQLSFDYGGVRVAAGDYNLRSFVPDQGAMRVITRDEGAESEARLLLERHGAVDLECLDSHAADPDSQADYLLSLEEDPSAYCAFVAEAVPQLRAQGFVVDIDADFPYRVLPENVQWFSDVSEDDQRPNWFQLELGVEIEGSKVNLVPVLLRLLDRAAEVPSLRALAHGGQRCIAVPVDERGYVRVQPERLRQLWNVLLELYEGQPQGDKEEAESFPLLCGGALGGLDSALEGLPYEASWQSAHDTSRWRDKLLTPAPELDPDDIPVRATLRPYQLQGVAWLQHLVRQEVGGVLADDMGLGKTLQTIAHLALEHRGARVLKPSMVICPKSLVGNWQRELRRFAPQLRVCVVEGPKRAEALPRMAGADVVVTTYPVLTRDLEAFTEQPLHLVVLDEAQAIKNRTSGTHQAVQDLDAEHRLCLSGTPVENHLRELFALFDFLNPGLLGDVRHFTQQGGADLSPFFDQARLEALHGRVKPFVLRRTKEEVAPELPPKTRVIVPVELGGKQRDLYESIRASAHEDVRKAIRKKGIDRCTITVLDALLKLRQLCCDPALVKMEAARFVRESAKYERLMELVDTHLGAGRRILIFSQFTSMLQRIGQGLAERNVDHLVLTGATNNRQAKVDAFEQGEADVFLLSLKAAGTGLNLTSADTVIHFDPWWNPAAQDQATDRAYRIGQQRPVLVQELIVAGSVEERIVQLQAHKRALAHALLYGPQREQSSVALSEAEVEHLFAPLA